MKKILVLILSLFLISSCSHKIEFSEENYKEVTFDVIEEKIKNKESFIYYLGSNECSNCKEYLKELEIFFNAHSNEKIYYVDVMDNFIQGKPYYEYKTILANISYYLDYSKALNGHEKNSLYTPTTFRVINGEYTFSMIGSISSSLLEEKVYDFTFNNIVYNELNYDESIKLLNGSEDFNFYLTRNDCSSCLEFKMLVNSFDKVDKEVTLNYLNLSDEILKDEDKMLWLKTYISNNLGSSISINDLEIKVPTLIKKRANNISIIEGVPSYTEFKDFLN